MKAAVVLAVMLLTALGSNADSGVPPSVHSVLSGGYWELDGKRGTYRVVVVNEGYEHVTSRMFVEWLQESSDAGKEALVISSVEPPLPFGRHIASFGVKLQPIATGQMRIVISGVISADPSSKVGAVFRALRPGEVRLTGRSSGPPSAAAELQR